MGPAPATAPSSSSAAPDGVPAELSAAELHAAFAGGAVRFVYQPIVELPGAAVVGFETLVRLRHPDRGVLGPAAFLELAEALGYGFQLAELAIDAACALLERTARPWVSMNLAPAQLADPEILELFTAAAARVDPGRLVVEVTEHSPLQHPTRDGRTVADVVADIAAAGFPVALDDFGTGASSLANLAEVPASVLKVDGSFTALLDVNPVGSAVIGAVAAMGAELGWKVVVEGVETAAQATALERLGVRFAQGYLYSAGVDPDEAAGMAAGTR